MQWLKQAAQWLLAGPFIALGWLAGFIVRCCKLMAALVVTGYRRGRRIE